MTAAFHALGWLLTGCSSPQPACRTFDELRVTDPDGAAPASDLDRVRQTVRDFAAWTGREGVCLSEVRIEPFLGPDEEPDVRATFEDGVLHLDAAWGRHPTYTVRELCRALDEAEALPSWRRRDLFLDGGVFDLELPATDRRRAAADDFARSCQEGPFYANVADAFRSCDHDPRWGFLLDYVYAGEWDPGFEWRSVETRRRRVAGIPDSLARSPVGGPGVIYLPVEVVAADGSRSLSLVVLDVELAEVTGTLAGPPLAEGARWSLFGGDGDPALVVIDDTEAEAYRVQDGALVAAAFPFVVDASDGVVVGDELVAELKFDDEYDLHRVDLRTGEALLLDVPEVDGGPDPLRGGAGRVAAPWFSTAGENFLAELDAPSLSWTLVDWPPGVTPVLALPLPGGRTLVRWYAALGERAIWGFGGHDPQTGWWFEEEPCAADGALRTSRGDFVLVDGAPLWLEWPDPEGGPGHDTFALIEVEWPR